MGIFVLIFSLCRLVFLVVNNDLYPVVYFTDFLAGIWFDIVTTAIVFLPLAVIELFPNKLRGHRYYQLFLAVAFHISLLLCIFINLIDIEYIRFTASRSTSSLFTMLGFGNDLWQQLPSFLRDYWYILILLFSFQLLGWWLYKRVNRITDDSAEASWLKQIIILPLMLALLVLTGRGGIGLKPIAAPNAAAYTIDQNTQLILNSAFTVIKTWGDVALEEKDYFASEELDKYFSPIRQYNDPARLNQPNVVIIMLESFSVEYISAINGEKEQYTPFLDELIQKSLVFNHCYANGKKSMDAVPAVVSSIPKLMEIEYLTSQYAANKIESLPKILHKIGYTSAFFHGATNGSMNFDVFAHTSGYDQYFGRSEYNNETDYDGTWGIYDEEFFLWTAEQLDGLPQPFHSTLFSISSHPPYAIPERYQDKFTGGPTEMHNSVRYTDYALKKFFDLAATKSWYENTLFVIVADHTPASSTPTYYKEMGKMHIPLVFYHPTDSSFQGVSEKVVSQADIMPSILHLIGYNEPFFAFGQSVFDTKAGYAASYVGNMYLYFGNVGEEGYLLTFQDEKVRGVYDLHDPMQLKDFSNQKQIREPLENGLKAMIQHYHHALINNAMTADKE